jgi:NTP pyrophosphatase (non-canonical NTP hydrolase)
MAVRNENLHNALIYIYPLLNTQTWRMVGAITEEAGEVQGAFNKWADKRIDKPKNVRDVMEETAQLIACGFMLAYHFDMSPDTMLEKVTAFIQRKTLELESGDIIASDKA